MSHEPRRIRVTLDFTPGMRMDPLAVAEYVRSQVEKYNPDAPWYLTSSAKVAIVGVMEQEDK